MRRGGLRGAVATMAVGCAVALAGCSGMPELPFDNPLDSLFATTSTEEALQELTLERTAALTSSELVEGGVLTVGLQTSSVTAPLCIVGANNEVQGMDVDIASALADELGLQVRFVVAAGAQQPLADNLCDVVMDVSAEHAGGATVVGGYYESAAAFFHRGEEGVVAVDALNGASVGLQEGSISQSVLSRTGLVMTERTYGNLNEAFDALNAGTIDYVLCDAYPGAYLAAAYDNISFAGALNAPTSAGIAVSAEKTTVQAAVKQALDAVSANGVMDVIRSRWVGGMAPITATDEIQNVPGAVVAPEEDAEAQEAGLEQDGSTAGSNAVEM